MPKYRSNRGDSPVELPEVDTSNKKLPPFRLLESVNNRGHPTAFPRTIAPKLPNLPVDPMAQSREHSLLEAAAP